MNITELARKLKVPTSELREKLPQLGFDIGLRAIKIDDQAAEKVMKIWRETASVKKADVEAVKEKVPEVAPEATSKIIALPPLISVREFSDKLRLPVAKVIGELLKNGVVANINEKIDYDTAAVVAEELGFAAEKDSEEIHEEAEADKTRQKLKELLQDSGETKLEPKPPVIVVMGHVDHGKTTLLDAIRATNVAASESGGITQHIGAYQIEKKGRVITFIDTPGHEAFKAMRLRGGRVADIAILVVAADDGLQPQTLESIKIIQQEKLPFIVAINKIDKQDADAEKVKTALSQINLLPEDWGGKTICVPISAKAKKGIDDLLEMILLLTEMDKDKFLANANRSAIGTIIESHIDKGEGAVATVLVQAGTLRPKDTVTAGNAYGRIKALKDFKNFFIEKATPGMPVKILGLKQVPEVGDILQVTSDKKDFKKTVKEHRSGSKRTPLEEQSQINKETEGVKNLNIILKADVLGSLEAICEFLEQIDNEEIKINLVKRGLGNIIEADILRAEMSHGLIIGFGVDVNPATLILARDKGVEIKTSKIIYELIDFIKEKMLKMLKPKIIRKELGEVKILMVFRTAGNLAVVGGQVIKDKITKGALVEKVGQNGASYQGKLVQLQLNKQDIEEVKEGHECGMKIEGRPQIAGGDILRMYREEEQERKIEEI